MQSIARGEVGIRLNQFTGSSVEVHEGAVLVVPGLHELRRFSLRDQVYRPADGVEASGPAPFQSVVHGVLYKTLARYTVREIFSSKRQEIQRVLSATLRNPGRAGLSRAAADPRRAPRVVRGLTAARRQPAAATLGSLPFGTLEVVTLPG